MNGRRVTRIVRLVTIIVALLSLSARPASGQTILVDTLSAQYRAYPALADTMLQLVRVHLDRMFRLDGWVVIVEFEQVDEEPGYVAGTYAQPRYRTAEIAFDLPLVARLGFADRMAVVRHEFFHVLLWQLTETALELARDKKSAQAILDALEETVVTDLERLRVWDQ